MTGINDRTEGEDGNPPSPAGEAEPTGAALPLTPFQRRIEDGVRKLKGRTRHAGLNAVHGLRRAWTIAPVDPEMAVFRAVTAEEEAATALISALQTRRYPGARELKPWKHPHKAGLMILIETLGRAIGESGFPRPHLHIQIEGATPRIDVVIPGAALGMSGHHITPDNPLNFSMGEGGAEGGLGERMFFAEQLAAFATAQGAKTIWEHFVQAANFRNQLLYASDQGRAVVEDPHPFILNRVPRVFTLLALTIIIMQTKDHQLFAQQALQAFLAALRLTTADSFDYSAEEVRRDLRIEVEKAFGEAPVVTLHKRPGTRGEE